LPLRHSGASRRRYTDPETGLQYLRARYYDPTTGQFVNRDPLASQTRDPFGYASRSPLNATDPGGTDPAYCVAGVPDDCHGGISWVCRGFG